MSFGLFAGAEPNPHPIPGEIAGPLLTYSLLWLGAWWVASGRRPLLGYALIICNQPWLRLLGVAMGGNDETVIASTLLGHKPSRVFMSLLVLVIIAGPMVIAFRSLSNRRRALVNVACYLALFVTVLLPIRFMDDRWFATYVRSPEAFSQPVLLGAPIVVWAVNLAITAAFFLVARNSLNDRQYTGSALTATVRAAASI